MALLRVPLSVLLVALTAAGCSLEPGGVFDRVAGIASPYSAPVRQGNWIEPEAVAQVRPGMTQEEVRLLLGSPLLVDPFHPNRWDYLYRFDNKAGRVDERRLTLFFEAGRLARIEGNLEALAATQ
jgi:outer membrane protein assembly factor BamE